MADIVDRNVVVLAPEEGDGAEFLAVPKHVERRRLPLALGNHPMFDTNVLAAVWIWPARNVAGREDPGRAGLEMSFTTTPRSMVSPALSAISVRGRTPMPATTRSASSVATALELHLLAVNGARRILKVEDNTVLLMERAHEVAHLRT